MIKSESNIPRSSFVLSCLLIQHRKNNWTNIKLFLSWSINKTKIYIIGDKKRVTKEAPTRVEEATTRAITCVIVLLKFQVSPVNKMKHNSMKNNWNSNLNRDVKNSLWCEVTVQKNCRTNLLWQLKHCELSSQLPRKIYPVIQLHPMMVAEWWPIDLLFVSLRSLDMPSEMKYIRRKNAISPFSKGFSSFHSNIPYILRLWPPLKIMAWNGD